MAVQASSLITKVRNQLVDTDTQKRWTDEEFLAFLSDAQRTIAALVPSAANKLVTIKLVQGTRQSIPADGHMLLGVNRNMGTTGTSPGRAVRLISRQVLDDQRPYWHSDPATAIALNYLYDPQDAKTFHVYPPANGAGHVEINYAHIPAEITDPDTEISISDIYQTALFDYVMFRAHQKDSDFAGGQGQSAMHLQAFQLFVVGRTDGEREENPNQGLAPFNPSQRGTAK